MNDIKKSIIAAWTGAQSKHIALMSAMGIEPPPSEDVERQKEYWKNFAFYIRVRFAIRRLDDLTAMMIEDIDSDDIIRVRFVLPGLDKLDPNVEVLNTDLILSWCIKEDYRI